MFTTYLSVFLMVFYIFLNTLFFLPFLYFLNEEKGVYLTSRVKKYYGKFVLWLVNAKVEVEYEDEEEFLNLKESKEPVVVVANHQSFVDIPLILGYVDLNLGFVAKEEIRKWGIFNLWMDRAQCVFLDRSNSKKALDSFKKAIEFIKNGKSICIFPEGTRTKDGTIGEFKKGSFKLALEPKVKILPVTIDGTFFIMNKNNFFVNRGKTVKLKISKTINLKEIERYKHVNINDFVKKIISENLKSV